jgi:hypothetical protein
VNLESRPRTRSSLTGVCWAIISGLLVALAREDTARHFPSCGSAFAADEARMRYMAGQTGGDPLLVFPPSPQRHSDTNRKQLREHAKDAMLRSAQLTNLDSLEHDIGLARRLIRALPLQVGRSSAIGFDGFGRSGHLPKWSSPALKSYFSTSEPNGFYPALDAR